MRIFGFAMVFLSGLALIGVRSSMPKVTNAPASSSQASSASDQALSFGGQPAITLVRPHKAAPNKPQFLEATILPGFGMNLLKLKAYLPGKGEVDVISSPDLADTKQLLERQNDEFGNQSFKFGGAILLPYPNRIRGTLSADGKTIETTVGDQTVSLPANWKGKNPGAEPHAMHGLILDAKFVDVKSQNGAMASTVSASYDAGDFGGHWPSKTAVSMKMTLTAEAMDIVVTTKNVGNEPLPMAIGAHPYFAIPSGDRQQVRLHVPADQRAIVNNYDDVFPTGEIVSVKGTPYDFTAPGGASLGALFMDESFTHLSRNARGEVAVEVSDPESHYGVRIVAVSPQIKAIQVYAPPEKDFIAVEPQFNLADPFDRKIWGKRDTGMVSLQPGQSVSWHIRIELFTPGGK
ncbi:MAG: aldose 1-epimerase [Candidatus Acidiferrales bacterium]